MTVCLAFAFFYELDPFDLNLGVSGVVSKLRFWILGKNTTGNLALSYQGGT